MLYKRSLILFTFFCLYIFSFASCDEDAELQTNFTSEETTTVQATTLVPCPGKSTRNETDNSCYCKPPYYILPNCNIYCDAKETCYDHGDCNVEGKCSCDSEWTGDNCNITCPGSSLDKDSNIYHYCNNDNGICNHGNCVCNSGYTKDKDGSCIKCDDSICNGHGQCTSNSTCSCNDRWTGPLCNIYCHPDLNCSSNGQCLDDGRCQCNENYYNKNCNRYCLANVTCSNQGTCNSDGTCKCISKYKGENCTIPVPDTPSTEYSLSDTWGLLLAMLVMIGCFFVVCCKNTKRTARHSRSLLRSDGLSMELERNKRSNVPAGATIVEMPPFIEGNGNSSTSESEAEEEDKSKKKMMVNRNKNWVCSCGFENSKSKTLCAKCLKKRTEAEAENASEEVYKDDLITIRFTANFNGNNNVDILVQYTNYTSYIYNDFAVQINSAKYCQCITDPLEDSLLPQAVKSIEHHVKMTKFDADQPFKLRLRVSFVKDGDSETITTPTIIVQKN